LRHNQRQKHIDQFCFIVDIANFRDIEAKVKILKNETTNTPASSPLRLALCLQLLSRFERMIVKIFS
jgi:hypothetical protein